MQFALTTQAFRDRRLSASLLHDVAASGFDRIELFAARDHFDYDDQTCGETLARWLDASRLQLTAVHAPTVERRQGQWKRLPSLADGNAASRLVALTGIDRMMALRADVAFDILVVHVGVPGSSHSPFPADMRDVARRSLEYVAESAARAGLRVALEVQANTVASIESLVGLVEHELDAPHVGICFDFGHAHLAGDVVDALETASGLVVSTHVHDNKGRVDDHLWPFEGTIDWGPALMTLQKLGYEGPYVLAPAASADRSVDDLLARATDARQRLADLLFAM